MNAYEVLNLPPTATKAEVRSAYRALARRWHPDRFMEGPERDWANEKMAEINAAYSACLRDVEGDPDANRDAATEARTLKRIEELIDGGQYRLARRMLMSIATRCAEWNYLFGAMLMKTRETRKALIYLRVAAHQRPENPKYARAFADAQRVENSSHGLGALLRRARER